jgi:hypothetical protein
MYELIIRRNRPDRPKPADGWLTASPEIMLFDVVYHMGKLTKAAFDGNWHEVIRQCANCANEFAMIADIAEHILNGPNEPMLGGDRALPPDQVAERKPGGWLVEPDAASPEPDSTQPVMQQPPIPGASPAPAPSQIPTWHLT